MHLHEFKLLPKKNMLLGFYSFYLKYAFRLYDCFVFFFHSISQCTQRLSPAQDFPDTNIFPKILGRKYTKHSNACRPFVPHANVPRNTRLLTTDGKLTWLKSRKSVKCMIYADLSYDINKIATTTASS